MAVNTAKQRMLEGKPAIGAEVGLGSPLSAELISPLGFDYVLVDNQHGAWADQSSMHAFRSISLGTAVPMARVRRNDFGLIGRLLDMGCMGIVVPMVNNAEEAEAAVFATRYPPLGGRSIGPFGTGFLGDDYDDWANDQIFLAVQIETDDGARNAEEIMAVDGIDGCWIGPGDLSRYMRLDLNTRRGPGRSTLRRYVPSSPPATVQGRYRGSPLHRQRSPSDGSTRAACSSWRGWTQCGSWTRLARR